MLLDISLHFLVLTVLGILVVVFLLIVLVLVYSFYQYRELTNIARWSKLIDAKVSAAIVFGNKTKPSKSLPELFKSRGFRSLFLEKLVGSARKFSGAAGNVIINLFDDYDLEKEALNKLNQKKIHLIVGGIQELTAMKVEKAVPKISTFLTHPSPQVYQEAQYAVVSFHGFEGLRFLDSNSNKISEWQQLRLLLSVSAIPPDCESTVRPWLESKNPSVIIFTLKLLRKFQMLSLYPLVWELMDHSSVEVRIQAVQTLQSLENSATVPDLAVIFDKQSAEVQLEILKAMRRSNDVRCEHFVKKQLQNHPSAAIKIHAAEVLFSLGFHNYLVELAADPSSAVQLTQIIKHAIQDKGC